MTIRSVNIDGREVRVSQEVVDRLKKTPKGQIKTVRERILQWAKKGKTPKTPTRPNKPKDPTPGKASRPRFKPPRAKHNIPAHVLFRKRHPIDRS